MAFLAVAAVLVVAGTYLLRSPSEPAFAATPPPLILQYVANPEPASTTLQRLATEVRAQNGPEKVSGKYQYVKLATWSLDIASSGNRTTTTLVPQQTEMWRANDGSGKTTRALFTAALPDPGKSVPQTVDQLSVRSESLVATEHGRGGIVATVPDPVPATVPELARALYDHQPEANGPQSAVRAVADLYRNAAVPHTARVATLEFLASAKGLVYRGMVHDRLGRIGIAVSVDSDGGKTRDILVIDEHTGALLSYECMFLEPPAKLPLRTPAVFSYVLYLQQDWRSSTA